MTQALRVLFAGTPEFAVPALRALCASSCRVLGVYTQPDRPAGRGRQVVCSPVKQLAMEQGLPVLQPLSLKPQAAIEELQSFAADVLIVAAYGLILPPGVLAAPRWGCINIHASLLPRWRGAAPIHRAILAGDAETGITIMRMDAGLDTGPMLLKRSCPIGVNDTLEVVHDRLAMLGAEALMDALPGIVTGSLADQPQDHALATYAQKVTKDEAEINWHASALDIHRQVCAFNPAPVAKTLWQGQVLRVWQTRLADVALNAPPGTVVEADARGVLVATGEGGVWILQLQLPGKRALSAAEFLNGQRILGDKLG